MITIPGLDIKDLEIFKSKKIVLYSHRRSGFSLYKCLKECGIEVACACKEEKMEYIQRTKDRVRGLVNITPTQLEDYIKKHDNVILQSVEFDSVRIEKVEKIAQQLGIESSVVTSGEIINSFNHLIEIKQFENLFLYICFRFNTKRKMMQKSSVGWKSFLKEKHDNPIIIVSPQKTADHAINFTFDAINQRLQNENSVSIDYFNLWHKPKCFNRYLCEKKWGKAKILVGVREPISQNLSLLYQRLSAGFKISSWMILEVLNGHSKKEIVEKYDLLFSESMNDVQAFWNTYTNIYADTKADGYGTVLSNGFIQWYFQEFSKHILDITNYPFDCEKGYAIIKEGNTEVFIYQLEKLNSLVPELSAWVGVPFDKLEKGNAAEDKWIAESYKQALKEIEITQEYFDKCFNEPYVKHCYSEADIEKFKTRWRPHIKKEA